MSPPKIFVTGATGYIGGDALHVMTQAHPDWQFSILVRDPSKFESIKAVWPNVRIVHGRLDDTDVLQRESAAADVIHNFATSDHVPTIQALVDGMRSDDRQRYLIQTSGTGNLTWEEVQSKSFGVRNPKIWDDIGDLPAVHAWPDEVTHHAAENAVFAAGDGYPNVKTAIIVPPSILGEGRGPGNKRTINDVMLIEACKKRGKAIQLGDGTATWSFVHIHDLSKVYLLITEAAVADGGKADWGRDGWYFAENGELEWGRIAQIVGRTLKDEGIFETESVHTITLEEALEIHYLLPYMIGTNSRSRASRTRKSLGWQPQISDFEAEIPGEVYRDLQAKQPRTAEFAAGHGPHGVH